MTSRMSNAAQVFNIPELAKLVSSFSQQSDLARLSQVSRRMFRILVPIVWQSVRGAHNLLRLIRSASLRYEKLSGKLVIKEIVLKNQSSVLAIQSDQFERFDLYAPHIQSLDVYDDERCSCAVTGWSLLISRSKHRPLLPKLRALDLGRAHFPAHGRDEILWITAFATDATLEVHTKTTTWFNPAGITYPAASKILEALINHCPEIEHLTIHTGDDVWNTPINSPRPNRDSEVASTPWYRHLMLLQSLRHMSITEGWLYRPALLALSHLPHLTSLEICPGDLKGFEPSEGLGPDLPPGSFPALRHLTLDGLHPLTTLEILRLKRMIKRLHSLSISLGCGLEGPLEADELHDDWVARKLLPLLENLPSLQDLVVMVLCSPEGVVHSIGVPEVLHTMSQIPLKMINLGYAHLGTGALRLDLGIVWPNVTDLLIPSQYASLQELSYFAAMPNLKHLVVKVDLTTRYVPGNLLTHNNTHECEIEGRHGSVIAASFETMEHNVRTLITLWPKARFISPFGNDGSMWQMMAKIIDNFLRYIVFRQSTRQIKNWIIGRQYG